MEMIKMADVRKYLGAAYLKVGYIKAADNGVIRVSIMGVSESERYDKLELELSDGAKLSLNVTNTRTLARAYGTDDDAWLGKEIELFVGDLEYNGKAQEVILLRPVSPPIEQKAQAKLKKSRRNDFDDEVPFA
jgi:hypothetical protein